MSELLRLSSAKAKDADTPEGPTFSFEVDGELYQLPPASSTLNADTVFAWAAEDDNSAMLKAAVRAIAGVADARTLAALKTLDQPDTFKVVNTWLADGSLGKSSAPRKSSAPTKARRRTTGEPDSGSASK